ncbi:hypothetical protein A5798_002817, partial [Enterococcus sp. 6C8_DIV0013]
IKNRKTNDLVNTTKSFVFIFL